MKSFLAFGKFTETAKDCNCFCQIFYPSLIYCKKGHCFETMVVQQVYMRETTVDNIALHLSLPFK